MQNTKQQSYNYKKFRANLYQFNVLHGAKAGEPAPDFVATTLDGHTVKLSDYFGKTIILETGSFTCPQYVARIKPMNILASEYPEFEFIVLYVREAHPGTKISEHHSLAAKQQLAVRTREEEQENRHILIDDLNGTAHQAYGGMPNMFYVIDADGVVINRSEWNNAPDAKKTLGKLRKGDSIDDVRYGFRPVPPHALIRVLWRAGLDAMWDFFTDLHKLLIGHAKSGQ